MYRLLHDGSEPHDGVRVAQFVIFLWLCKCIYILHTFPNDRKSQMPAELVQESEIHTTTTTQVNIKEI